MPSTMARFMMALVKTTVPGLIKPPSSVVLFT